MISAQRFPLFTEEETFHINYANTYEIYALLSFRVHISLFNLRAFIPDFDKSQKLSSRPDSQPYYGNV